MTESLANRMQICKDRYNDIPQCLIDEVQVMEDKSAIYKKRPSKPYEENKMPESLTDRLINLFHRCDSSIRIESIQLTDEVRALGLLVVKLEEKLDDIDTCELCEGEVEGCSICLECWNKLAPGATELKTQLAEYKYTPQSYDEMWARVKEAVNENDELKAHIADWKKAATDRETLIVEAEVAIGGWLSAALDDPNVCAEMKQDIARWFAAQETN